MEPAEIDTSTTAAYASSTTTRPRQHVVCSLSIGRVWQQGGQRNRERLVVPERNRSCTAFPTS
uniref:Uncharacterized protein n=1 Tax=Heterorhabditis bacteriophora TaxID=37862 RepID=A0A1I7WGT1_HETBA